MRKRLRLFAPAFALLAAAAPARADEVAPASNNVLWEAPPAPVGDPATPGQFGGFSAVTSSASTGSGALPPANGDLTLRVSFLGSVFATAPPEFAMGDVIGTPLQTFTSTGGAAIGLRRQPVRMTEAPFRYCLPPDPLNPGNPVNTAIFDFDPATDILSERFFWSPHARFGAKPDLSGKFEETAPVGAPGATTRDGFVYASQPGALRVFWRTTAEVKRDSENRPVFGLVERATHVSSASRLPVRRIFWTEEGFLGQPVNLGTTEVQAVNIAYNESLPQEVPHGSQYGYNPPSNPLPGEYIAPTRRTFWHDPSLKNLRAFNREGRILVEFLGEPRAGGLRRQIGVEVVDVIQEATPSPVDVYVGDRVFPLPPDQAADQPYPLPLQPAARQAAMARIDALLAAYEAQPVLSTAHPPFNLSYEVGGNTWHYATRSTSNPADVQFFWAEQGIAGILWPRFLNRYNQFWPQNLDEFALNIRPSHTAQSPDTPPIFGAGSTFHLVFQDNGSAVTSSTADFIVNLNSGTPVNRTLLRVTAGNAFWFLRIESVLDTHMAVNPRYSAYHRDLAPDNSSPLTALVGRRILPPVGADSHAGFVDLSRGDAIDPTAYLNPFTAGFAEAEANGAIIPVNAAPKKGAKPNDKLAVWWFKKVHPPAELAGEIPPVMFPTFHHLYQLVWPLDAPQIVLASNAGSGDLPADAAQGFIYYENDPAKPGYNPNEEHALMISGRAYALRDDLNTPATTSSPYVLVRHTNALDGRPDMRVFRVLRENETHTFDYPAMAGTVLRPPSPLNVMPPPLDANGNSKNTEVTPQSLDPALNIPGGGLGDRAHYNAFTYEDRKGLKWIYRGQHNPDGNTPALEMKFYYNTLEGFAFPNPVTGINDAPEVGTITPYLHDGQNGDNKTGTPITVRFRPYWPDIGSKHGLRGTYFDNIELSGVPPHVRLDSQVNFHWPEETSPAPGVNPWNYSVRWEGFVVITRSGDYTFHIETDDGFYFWLGNTQADPTGQFWSYRDGPVTVNTEPRFFHAGQKVPVRLEMFKAGGPGTARLRWSGPGISNQTIPAANLIPADTDAVEVPVLQFAETLVKPKFNLPGLDGASSAHILYQQSVAKDASAAKESAKLHDPTRLKTAPLPGGPPSSIATDDDGGRLYFQGLPAHLQQRVYFDPSLIPDTPNPVPGALVLEGKFHDEILGEDYIDLNVLSSKDIAAIKNLADNDAPGKAAWTAAVDNLRTTVQTFEADPANPGALRVKAGGDRIYNSTQLAQVTHPDQAVDSYALTAVGDGEGYVTLILGGGEAFTDESEPVTMHILRVGPQLYRGQLKPVPSANPLSESLTLAHTGDFAGHADRFEFEWYYSPPVRGQPQSKLPDDPEATWFPYDNFEGPRAELDASQPLLALTDNYFVMRYRPAAGHALRPAGSNWADDQGWSQWTDPALAEGWIKRVLAGINPFNQRVSDFLNNGVNTDVSLLTQAGARWEGDIPLTLDAVQNEGLIAIYETVLRRGMAFTIEGAPPVDYAPANDALLLAAGYLNDLYMALGNEAFADASNPLISLDVDPQRLLQNQGLPASIGTTIETTASSRFAFEGQVPTLLDEELVLLRGRDDFLVPGTRTAPVYNRFVWNFTRGINAGEVIYALNYNITEKPGVNADGRIDAADAARMFPQGHGDAYGHYLTALKNYYRLLANPHFTWTPRVEAVNVLGVPVTVDYFDERRLAAAAVSLARTASRILDLERRKLPADADAGWEALRHVRQNSSTELTRAWGVEHWASRAGQGNFLHWAAVNALLPEEDSINEGLQKIDRSTVPELQELAILGAEIQTQLDAANQRVNALNMAEGSILFDLNPGHLTAGQSHFDQTLAKAKAALANAAAAHERTIRQNALLRTVENQAADYTFTVEQQEWAFINQLYDVYGMPYAGDIGPGKLYPQGYDGPDFFNYMFINRPQIYTREHLFGIGQAENWTREFILPVRADYFNDHLAGYDGSTGMARRLSDLYNVTYDTVPPVPGFTSIRIGSLDHLVKYKLNLNDGPWQFATPAMGQRAYTGSLQNSLHEILKSKEDLFLLLRSLDTGRVKFATKLRRFAEDVEASNKIIENDRGIRNSALALEKAIGAWELYEKITDSIKDKVVGTMEAVIESMPKTLGLAFDGTAPARGAIKVASNVTKTSIETSTIVSASIIYAAKFAQDVAALRVAYNNEDLAFSKELRATIAELESSYAELFSTLREVDLAARSLDAAYAAYQNQLASGLTVLAERDTFRKRAAAVIQGARARDVAFRAFRTESLEQYKILFDQAARYTWLAAKAYDYETGQLGNAAGRQFLAGIVSTRALGLVGANGEPLFAGASTGDPGLSSHLAKLQADWNVVKGRLGINNPDTYGTVFSLRRELFQLPYKEDGSEEDHTAWQDRLRASLVKDLRTDPVVAAHALPTSNPSGLAQPGFIIDFPTVIETGLNFFGNPVNAGDSHFSSASFSTKVHSVGVVFKGYLGMNPSATGATGIPPPPTHNHPDALSATPYCYLLPAGADVMRTPPLGGAESLVREWHVHDHAMPLPFDIAGGGFGSGTMWTSNSSLSEPFFLPRRHQPFRASDNTLLFYAPFMQDYTNRRLIGRSVWNTNWKLVIPAQTLLANPQEGIERFIRSVKDIKLFLKTYSHSGN